MLVGRSPIVVVLFALIIPTVGMAHAVPAPSPMSAAQTADATSLAGHLATVYGHDERLDVGALTLDEGLRAMQARLGTPAAPTVATGLDAALVEPVSTLLSALVVAHDARDAAYRDVDDAVLLSLLGAETDPDVRALADRVDTRLLQRAALTVAAAVDETLPLLRARADSLVPAGPFASGIPPAVDLAPVLVVDPDGADNLHTRDAALVVDLGGDDVYDTNAGGALIHQGLVGDPASCQVNLVIAVACENEDSFAAFSASLLIDLDGDDTYGVPKPPRPGSRDAQCTSEPIIRRVVVQGSGSGGLGMLVDAAGRDVYLGKTLAQGNGHIGGVGALFDLDGDDRYEAIRAAMGSSVLGGTGSLYDHAGDDRYIFRAPAGGLWNVDQARCDTTARLGLGAAAVGGSGHFTDTTGNDTYRIEAQGLGFATPPDAAHFLDGAGIDDYGGYAERGDDVMRPGPGLFVDTQS